MGIGERRAVRDTDIMSGNVKLALSHVVPDLVLKTLKGQDPLHILGDGRQVRHYTYGGDLAHGIRLAMESRRRGQRRLQPLDGRLDHGARAGRGDLEQGPRGLEPFRYVSDPPFEHDVQLRVPDVRKAREVLGFEATTDLADDAGRGHPVDPRRAGGRTAVTELSVVVPVFKEGEAVEPVLRALDAGVSTPHEILVVYDFDEDPTVPVIDRLHAELPAIRGLRNDLGRGVLNAMRRGSRPRPATTS